MPIYEFYCPDNHTIYSFLGKSSLYASVVPRCPADPSFRMVRIVSEFAAPRKRTPVTGAGAAGQDQDDARIETAMAQMEREFGSMDPDNPDPRALAGMMRRMAEISGEKIDARMEEVCRRLEEGADPESLEDEYGDLLTEEPAEESSATGDDQAKGGEREAAAPASKPLIRLRPPKRDPNLYDFEPMP